MNLNLINVLTLGALLLVLYMILSVYADAFAAIRDALLAL